MRPTSDAHANSTSSLRSRAAIVLGAFVFFTVVAVGLASEIQHTSASHDGGMDAMSIDMDVTGNTATSLGPREDCIEVSAGAPVTFDVTATNIPATDPIFAFSFTLNYPSSSFSVIAADHDFLLASSASSSIFDASDPKPDSDGTFLVAVLDTGIDAHESGSGVLSRITIDTAAAAPGVYSLFLENAAHLDINTGEARSPDVVNNAFLAVDDSCENLPTPTLTPSPSPPPPPPPEAEASVGIDHDGGSPDINPGPAFAANGDTATVSLVTEAPDDGLGAWNIDVHYDPSVLSVVDCVPYGGLAVCNPAFSVVEVRVVGADASGIFGAFNLADITFEMVGSEGECSILEPEIVQYATVDAEELTPDVFVGAVCNPLSAPAPTPTPAPTPAPGGPVGGCPQGDQWTLAPVAAVIDEIDNGNFADQNGDGFGCFRENKGQTKKHGASSWTWKDNTNPLP